MNFIYIFIGTIIGIGVIILFFLFLYLLNPFRWREKFDESWHELKLHKVPIKYGRYVKYKVNLWYRKMPSSTLFKQYIRVYNAGYYTDFKSIKNMYRNLAGKIERELTLHRKRNIVDSLNLYRIGGNYVITGDMLRIFQIIQKSYEIDTSALLQTQLKKNADIKKHKQINDMFKQVVDETLTSFSNYPTDTNDSKINSANKKERELLIAYVVDDLRNRLKLQQTYLLDAVGVKYSKKGIKFLPKFPFTFNKTEEIEEIQPEAPQRIFLDISLFERLISAFVKAKQAGLSFELTDLSSYFDMGGDFELIVDVLIKSKQFDFKEELEEIEKYIYVDYNIEETIAHLIRARKINPDISLKDLEKHISLGGDAGVFVNAIIKAHYGQVVINPNDLNKYFSNGGKVEKLISALVKLKKENIDINFEDLSTLKLEGGDIEQIINDIVRAKHVGLSINLSDIQSYLSQDIDPHQLIDVLIKNETFDLNISIDDLRSLARINVDLDIFYRSLSLDKRIELGVNKDKLVELQTVGVDMFNYVMALKINKENDLKINPLEFEIDFLEKRNVLPVLLEMVRTKNTDNVLSYKFGIALDKLEHNVTEIVNWALNPQVITVDLEHIVTQDAFSIKPTVNVMVKGKLYKYIKGSREDVLKARVNEAFISEIELFDSYQSVLQNLNEVSERVLNRLNAKMDKKTYEYFENIDNEYIKKNNEREAKSNEQSAYEILDISVQNVEVGTDILAKLKKDMAELEYTLSSSKSRERRILALAKAAETKTRLIESEAELKKGLAEAFRTGTLKSSNEYHKYKIIHEDEEYMEEDSTRDLHDEHRHDED